MKEFLLKILGNKLDNINENIDELTNINNKIQEGKEKLEYTQNVVNTFKDDNGNNNIYNLTKIEKDEFNNILSCLDSNINDLFNTSSCNYDGLTYLINGINNGISLTLTKEQEEAINEFIVGINKKVDDYNDGLKILEDGKNRLEISDLDKLSTIKSKYEECILKLKDNEYVDDFDTINEAIKFNNVSDKEVINMLTELLHYNAEIFEKNKSTTFVEKEEDNKEIFEELKIEDDESKVDNNIIVENNDVEIQPNLDELNITDNIDDSNTFHIPEFNTITFDDEIKPNKDVNAVEENDNLVINEDNQNEKLDEETYFEEYTPTGNIETNDSLNEDNKEVEQENENNLNNEESVDTNTLETTETDIKEEVVPEEIQPIEESINDTVTEEKNEVINNEKTVTVSQEEVSNLFINYGIDYFDNDLLYGNINNYHEILKLLNDKNILNLFTANKELFKKMLLTSNIEKISNTLKVIEKDLSVDRNDYKTTLDIVIKTMPSVFVSEPDGNQELFINNVRLLKNSGINLITLFDFSKEIFLSDSNKMQSNYNIVNAYDLEVDAENAKYLLTLPNIAERIDYYLEVCAKDNMPNGSGKKFDGLYYIKHYPEKLSIVSDTIIKRLRYSSEMGKKLFGNKEGSLAGEITNMKVDVLNIPNDYLDKYFNNEFDIISKEEVQSYQDLLTNHLVLNGDELKLLKKYRDGIRYNINGLYFSRCKVSRIYNTLINNGIDTNKALLFAFCYNSVITKDEYQMVKDFLTNLGGN